MSHHFFSASFPAPRRESKKIWLKSIAVGGDAPISVQTMTNTPTEDFEATRDQVQRLKEAGAEIIRVSVNNFEAAEGFKKLCRFFPDLPLVADIHFDWRLAVEAIRAGAACLRLNPGNLGNRERVRRVLQWARGAEVPIRIGVNGGSLPKDLIPLAERDMPSALVKAAERHLSIFEEESFEAFKISVKASDPRSAVEAYRQLARKTKHPLHLGITEAGGLQSGTVKSSVGLGILLSEGLGDTLRVSLAADPVEEVRVGFEILKALKLRSRGVDLIACPSCSRQQFDVIGVTQALEQRLADITSPLEVAVIGCVVNGPGECTRAHLGVSGCQGSSPLYCEGKRTSIRLENTEIAEALERHVRQYLEKNPPS